MKYIEKKKEPTEFSNWKKKANPNWKPTFEKLAGKEKLAVSEALKKEQGYICCYCESKIESAECHIEHLVPQHLSEVDSLDFSNMLSSCQKNLEKHEPRHCGNSKGEWYDKSILISPLNTSCAGKFKYYLDGRIEPLKKNDTKTKTTIEKLQLGIDNLNAKRKSAILPFIDPSISQKEAKRFARTYLAGKNTNNGKFNEFYTTIKYLFG